MAASVLSTPAPPVLSQSKPSSVEHVEITAQEKLYTISYLVRTRAQGSADTSPSWPIRHRELIMTTILLTCWISSSRPPLFTTPRSLHSAVHQRILCRWLACFGPSDFEYLITLTVISRLGHTALLLSTRIAEDAYVSLMESTKSSFLITYPNFKTMGENVAKRTGAIQVPVISPLDPNSSQVCNARLPIAELDGPTENQHVCWVIHSSGSTGVPKPIYQTHSGALKNYANNFGLKGFITLPLFHAHGISCLFRAVHSEQLIYMYNACLPLTATALLTTLKEHPDIQILYAVPYALKLLSESEKGLRCMARLELVMFGGSSLPKPIGDVLVQNGVRLVSHYGTTETGQLMTSFRDRSDLDWDYVRPGPALLPYIRWEEQPDMPGIYELCILEGWPSKVASNRPDNSYATKDLFEKHPTTPNAWRYYARLDDTLVLENGEKANPLTIEGVARKNPNIGEAIAFGSGKSRLGLFVVPSEKCLFKTDEELVDAIFPEIEECNAASPAYAYISRDMIFVLPMDVEYRRTDKGTVIRSAFYQKFADKINDIYESLDGEADVVLEGADLIKFLRQALLEIASNIEPSTLLDTTDVFSLGIDSLQSIRLRSAIMKTLDLNGKRPSQNFVFENPSLQALADAITHLRLGKEPKEQIPVEERMEKLIKKYGTNFKTHRHVSRDSHGQYVVLTGATGSLGAHIAAQLAQSDNVHKVYCFVRANSSISARRRVAESLRNRALSSTLFSGAERKIVALPADLSNSTNFGLDDKTFDQIKKTVTSVIHCAWSVNFNWALESFEQSCIVATRNLLDLCLSAEGPRPASFSFCSSVSTVARTPGNWVSEALPESLSYAQGMGYAQSKLVTENIVNRAAEQTGMTARVLRAGQIVADTVHGIWNATEAIPMILQTAKTIKALPQLDDVLSWTPVDVMASSIIELSFSAKVPSAAVMNVTNPTLSHWTQQLLPLLREAGLDFEVLPKKAWLHRLRDSNQDPEVNPPIKLLEFFASKYDNDHNGRVLLYDTKLATAGSPSLANAASLTSEFASHFIHYFETQCWNKTDSPAPSRDIIFLIGPCGCGKSTAARVLQQQLQIPMIEGDNFHSPAARQKTANNLPLEDSDRWEWLAHIRGAVMDRLQNTSAPAVVVTCSALRTIYRDELRRLSQLFDFPVTVTFLLLSMQNREQLKDRMMMRSAQEQHYMKSPMVDSQLDLFESPTDEPDVIELNSSQKKEKMLEDVVETVKTILN